MYMSMRSDRFARLFSYEQARKHYQSIKPYAKGRNKGLVPFAERGRAWLTMRQEGEDYVIRLYRTDVIRFKPNGDIVVQQNGWNTPSTHEVIARILGTQIFQRHYVGWIVTKGGTYPLRKEGECVFRGVWNKYYEGLQYINPELPVIHVLKRKEYNTMRKKYKAFETHLMGMLKLRDYMRPTNEETASVLGKYYEPLKIEEMMAMIDNEEMVRGDSHVTETLG